MIFIDRNKIEKPPILSSERVKEAIHDSEVYFQGRKWMNDQSRFEFDSSWYRAVRIALSEALRGKCFYCESRIGTSPEWEEEHYRPKGRRSEDINKEGYDWLLPDMEHFRPIRTISEAPNRPGYWWLAYEWSNLLVACRACNSAKGNRFPLASEKNRARDPGEELREDALLLDPCSDQPQEHLVFGVDGTIFSQTSKGQTTIAVLNLNRVELVERRFRFIQNILSIQETMERSPQNFEIGASRLMELTEASSEFAGVARQFTLPWLEKYRPHLKVEEVEWKGSTPNISEKQRIQAQQSYANFEKKQATSTLQTKSGRKKALLQRRQVEHISIRNFKSLGKLDLTCASTPDTLLNANDSGDGFGSDRSSSSSFGRPIASNWLMLLGENGTGKSSILQAVAMALMGTEDFTRILSEQGHALNDFVQRGKKQASIAVKVSGFSEPFQLLITKDRARFQHPSGSIVEVNSHTKGFETIGKPTEVPTVLLAYGATRLLRHKDDLQIGHEFSRVDNLFDPLIPLLNAERWLLGLKAFQFNQVAIVLKDLLCLDTEARLLRRRGKVYVQTNDATVTLRQLSDGFQSVIAMTVDVLEVAIRLWQSPNEPEGIVLLDEIGSHLHPAWRIRIVESLRRAFPRLQFLVTTHEPLCLRGIRKGEIVVLKRDEDKHVEAITDLPSPDDFRVDQLLTSEFFGLNSTTDPRNEALFNEYYALLAMRERSGIQEERLAVLKQELKDRRFMGVTQRDQLMNEAIDRILAQQRTENRLTIPQLNDAATAALAEIWNSNDSN